MRKTLEVEKKPMPLTNFSLRDGLVQRGGCEICEDMSLPSGRYKKPSPATMPPHGYSLWIKGLGAKRGDSQMWPKQSSCFMKDKRKEGSRKEAKLQWRLS
jgi:hypothetical protein